MRLPRLLTDFLLRTLLPTRKPDFIVGTHREYMRRWWLIPRNRVFNVYLHRFMADDDDRALHDHPWWSVSVLLDGSLWETFKKASGDTGSRFLFIGDVVFRSARFAHRLAIPVNGMTPVTLFITGPNIRQWGFHCPQGWRHWRDFTAGPRGEAIGRGCD